MTKKSILIAIILAFVFVSSSPIQSAETRLPDRTEEMKKSLVYLEISCYGYEQYQPWRNTDLSRRSGYACAVGPYEVITTAWNVTNAVLIKARVYARNEFLSAKVKFVDYESNLCLIELDADALGS